MPQINTVIPPQSFEVIQDKIVLILKDEVPNQATLAADPTLNATIFKDRLTPVGHQECPVVNVVFTKSNFQPHTQRDVKSECEFMIEIHTSGKETGSVKGYEGSAAHNRRLARIIRGILEAPEYKTLGFSAPFIQWRKFTDYAISEPQANQDANYMVRGQMIFTVSASDANILQAERELEASDVVMKIDDTDKGHKFEFQNN